MLPDTGWSFSQDFTKYADYHLTKPVYTSKNPFELELGSIELNNSGGVINACWWKFEFHNGGVYASRYFNGVFEPETLVFSTPHVTQLSASFDQLGRPLVFYNTGTELRLFWFDPVAVANTTTVFGVGSYPFSTFDYRWDTSNPRSDVMLFYIRAGGIYYRLQRDRYDIEYATPVTEGVDILEADMTVDYRMQLDYRYRDTSYSPAAPTAPSVDPTAGKWAYLLNGYQSALEIPLSDEAGSITSNIVSYETPFSVSFEIKKAERVQEQACLFSYGSPGFGPRVSVSIGGINNDTLYVRYWGGAVVQKMPFKLQDGHWKLAFYRLNGTGANDTLRVSVKPPNASDYLTHVVNNLSAKILASAPLLRIGNRAVYSEQFYRVPGDFSTAYTVSSEYAMGLRGIISNIELVSEAMGVITLPMIKEEAQAQQLRDAPTTDEIGAPITDALGAPLTANLVDYRAANWAFIPT